MKTRSSSRPLLRMSVFSRSFVDKSRGQRLGLVDFVGVERSQSSIDTLQIRLELIQLNVVLCFTRRGGLGVDLNVIQANL